MHNNVLRAYFNVHRKLAFLGVSIHEASLHTRAHKHAAINSAIRRFISLPLTPEAQKIEAKLIQQLNVNLLTTIVFLKWSSTVTT